MAGTPYPDINALLADLLAHLQDVLGDQLVGLYLYGSLVWGDFDYDSSDIDLLAATQSTLTDREAAALKQLHDHFARVYPQWQDRIEVQYASLHALKTFKSQASAIAVISPGEPFHVVRAGDEWLMNWYFVQTYGVTLFGPDPTTFIEPITKAEFREAARAHAAHWRTYVAQAMHSRPYQAYAILTMCRALYTVRHGEQVSKQVAAAWAIQHLPDWAPLIQNALVWRAAWREAVSNHTATFAETCRFVEFVWRCCQERPFSPGAGTDD